MYITNILNICEPNIDYSDSLREYNVVNIHNGNDALSIITSQPIDLILIDSSISDWDIFELTKHISDIVPPIPIIVIYENSPDIDEHICFDSGAVDFIHKPVNPKILSARIKSNIGRVHNQAIAVDSYDAIHMLAKAGHYHDGCTGEHVMRISKYSQNIALALGWDNNQSVQLGRAASLHDTGKIGIPDSILKKDSKLTPEEYELIKQHSMIGYTILNCSKTPVFQLAAQIARHHHERWDGRGYPDKLKDYDIPVESRVVAIADVIDALISPRHYKRPWLVSDVKDYMISQSGIQFDPNIIEVIMQQFDSIFGIGDIT